MATFIYLAIANHKHIDTEVDELSRKVTMKEGDFLQEVPEEKYYPVKVMEISDYTPKEGSPDYGDAIYIHYDVYKVKSKKAKSMGSLRELCSLKMTPRSRLFDRWTNLMGKKPKEGEEVDVDDLVDKEAYALLVNDEKGDTSFVTIQKMKPMKATPPEEEEEEEEEEESEEEEVEEEAEAEEDLVECGECGEDISDDETTCPHCGAEFEEEEEEEVEEEKEEEEEEEVKCDWCGEPKKRRDFHEADGLMFHDEHGLRCKDEYLKEKKAKKKNTKKKAPKKSTKTAPKKKPKKKKK